MLKALINRVRGWRAQRDHEGKLRDARKARAEASRLYFDAWERGDHRDMGRFSKLHTQATSDLLRLEVGRRAHPGISSAVRGVR